MDSAGEGKDGMFVRMSVHLFARELRPLITMSMKESFNGIALFDTVSTAVNTLQQRGTYTYLVFEDLINQKDTLITENGTISSDGYGLNVIFVTDAMPYILGGSAKCKALAVSYGNPYTGKGRLTPEACGTHMHTTLLAEFRATYPKARIWGYSPTDLPQEFVEETYNSVYYTSGASTSSIDTWQDNINDAVCNNAAIITGSPTPYPTSPTKKPTTGRPSKAPTAFPTYRPSTGRPSSPPTTGRPSTAYPTGKPTTGRPSNSPTTGRPSTAYPTSKPTTGRPSKSPTRFPTARPSTGRPSKSPTTGRPTTAYPTLFR